MLQKLYTETRLVIADKFLIWKLLTSSSQLANWMPNVKSIEHLGNDSLCTGSLLWVEMWALFQKKKMSNIIIVSAWEYLDSLDFAITQHRKNN